MIYLIRYIFITVSFQPNEGQGACSPTGTYPEITTANLSAIPSELHPVPNG